MYIQYPRRGHLSIKVRLQWQDSTSPFPARCCKYVEMINDDHIGSRWLKQSTSLAIERQFELCFGMPCRLANWRRSGPGLRNQLPNAQLPDASASRCFKFRGVFDSRENRKARHIIHAGESIRKSLRLVFTVSGSILLSFYSRGLLSRSPNFAQA